MCRGKMLTVVNLFNTFILCGRCERKSHVMNGLLKRKPHVRLVSSTFTFHHIRCRFQSSSNTVSHSSSSHYPHSSTGKHHRHIDRDHLLTIIITFPAIIYWNNFVHLTVILRHLYVLRYGEHRSSTLLEDPRLCESWIYIKKGDKKKRITKKDWTISAIH